MIPQKQGAISSIARDCPLFDYFPLQYLYKELIIGVILEKRQNCYDKGRQKNELFQSNIQNDHLP